MATEGARGFEQIARLISGATTAGLYWEYMALGCGSPAESNTHTTLHQEMTTNGGQRGAATNYYMASDTAAWKRTFPITGSTVCFEAGLFTTTSLVSATMLMRHKFASAKNLSSGDGFTVTLTAVFS